MPRVLPSIALTIISWLLLAAQLAGAQSPSGSIRGSVHSSEQVALGAVTVKAVHLPSSHVRTAVTDESGHFTLTNLPLGGPYVIQVSHSGYHAEAVENVFLSPEQPASLAFALRRTGRSSRKSSLPSAPSVPVAAPSVSTKRAEGPQTLAPAPVPEPVLAASVKADGAGYPAPGEPPRTYAHKPRYTPHPTPKVAPATPGHFDAKTGNYVYETGAPVTLKLPGGGLIKGVGSQSTESLLHRFLTDPTQQVDTINLTHGWINFDRVFFEPGRATLTPESQEQLRNLAALLKAFPQSRVKIGGYTDSTGVYKVNRELSEARARTAWAALLDMGIAAGRIEARGYGPRYAIAPNTTEEGRAMNRRLSVKVLRK